MVDAQKRTFQNAAVTLSGTLHVPKIEGRNLAVIVFHAASSPTRDNPLNAHLVERLPPLGIAVFIFDRRGSLDALLSDDLTSGACALTLS